MTIELGAQPPSIQRTVVHEVKVSLADFKVEDVAEYLREQGYCVNGAFSGKLLEAARNRPGHTTIRYDDDDSGTSGLLIPDEELAHIETLLWCGQADAARDELVRIAFDHIGRVPA